MLGFPKLLQNKFDIFIYIFDRLALLNKMRFLFLIPLVALNYQTADDPMMLNKGKFRDNGGCGFVLKPEYMRKGTVCERFHKVSLIHVQHFFLQQRSLSRLHLILIANL